MFDKFLKPEPFLKPAEKFFLKVNSYNFAGLVPDSYSLGSAYRTSSKEERSSWRLRYHTSWSRVKPFIIALFHIKLFKLILRNILRKVRKLPFNKLQLTQHKNQFLTLKKRFFTLNKSIKSAKISSLFLTSSVIPLRT